MYQNWAKKRWDFWEKNRSYSYTDAFYNGIAPKYLAGYDRVACETGEIQRILKEILEI